MGCHPDFPLHDPKKACNVHLLVCSSCGELNQRQMYSVVRPSVHGLIPLLYVEFDFSPAVYLSPYRVMIFISIYTQRP